MELKVTLLIAVLLVCQTVLIATEPGNPLQIQTKNKGQVELSETPSPKITLIGVIGSHTYFYDQGRRNWEDSRSFCQSLGMDLAELPTQAHFQLLADYANVDPNFDVNNYYWISARDSGELSQFVWDATNGTVPADLPYGGLPFGPKSCLFYQTGSRLLFGTPCIDNGNMVMCQT